MSDHQSFHGGPGPGGDGGSKDRHAPSWAASGRRASVTLRQGGPEETGSLMDPATQSLSDALRITYRFVQIAVVALAVFYVLSGFRRVHEGERGIRLLFGRVIADDIGPGFRFSWPEPFGELVKVTTGAQPAAIDDDFFPQLTDDEKKRYQTGGIEALNTGGRPSLNPESDGSLLTGDGNLAHARWAVTYHREDPKQVEENIDPEFEKSIVLAACKRGIVQATAAVTIDELLKNSPDDPNDPDWRPIEVVAREVAQATLNEMSSGIRIDMLSMSARVPPFRTLPAFNEVQSSVSDAKKMEDEASEDRKSTLLAAAGEAAEVLLAEIEKYGRAIELEDHDAAEQTLARIEAIMEGTPVEIDGVTVNPRVYGRLSDLLSEADRDRRTHVARLQGEVQRFMAKLDNYRSNPTVLVNSEWADAYGRIMSRQSLQSMFLPQLSDGRYVLTFGTDPEVAKNIQQEINRQKADEANRIRQIQAEKERWERKIESLDKASE